MLPTARAPVVQLQGIYRRLLQRVESIETSDPGRQVAIEALMRMESGLANLATAIGLEGEAAAKEAGRGAVQMETRGERTGTGGGESRLMHWFDRMSKQFAAVPPETTRRGVLSGAVVAAVVAPFAPGALAYANRRLKAQTRNERRINCLVQAAKRSQNAVHQMHGGRLHQPRRKRPGPGAGPPRRLHLRRRHHALRRHPLLPLPAVPAADHRQPMPVALTTGAPRALPETM